MTTKPESPELTEELRQLVRAAFEQARRRGRASDKSRMRSAVLKNRLLQMTNNEFSEARFGGESMASIMQTIPDLISIESRNPTIFRFLEETVESPREQFLSTPTNTEEQPQILPDPTSLTSAEWEHVRIREDLWKAILDYSSRTTWVWDKEKGLARPREVLDAQDLPSLPTATDSSLHEWRKSYVDELSADLAPKDVEILEEWRDGAGALAGLPRRYREGWLELLKRRVTQRLLDWFAAEQILPPPDLLLQVESKHLGRPNSPKLDEVVASRQLRSYIIQVLEMMTLDELEKLPIPAVATMRFNARTK